MLELEDMPVSRCIQGTIGLRSYDSLAMGGYGFTSRMWGLTIDTVEEAEVVLGNGTVVVASQGENSDLLWVRQG